MTMKSMTRKPRNWSELINGVKRGEDAAFAELYVAFSPLVRKHCRVLREDVRDDVEQEIWLSVWKSIKKDRETLLFLVGLIEAIAVGKVSDAQREAYADSKAGATLVDVDDPELFRELILDTIRHGADIPTLIKVSTEEFNKLISDLPEKKQVVAKLHFVDGLERKEIARITRLRPHTIHRILCMVANRLKSN